MDYQRISELDIDDQGPSRIRSESTRSSLSEILENVNLVEDKKYSEQERLDPEDDEKKTEIPPSLYKRRLIIIAASFIVSLFIFVPIYLTRPSQEIIHKTMPVKLAPNRLTLEDMRKGLYRPASKSISWTDPLPGAEESTGDFIVAESDGFYLTSWADKNTKQLLLETTINANGENRAVSRFKLNANRTKVVVGTDTRSNWRHSSFALYWIVDVETKKVDPLYTHKPDVQISIAEWSPVGDKVVFVYENNLYIRTVGGEDDGRVHQITFDGGKEIFYGRPDWVYEEEVLADDKALWWSPDGDYLAFFRTNDSSVLEFPIPYFVQKGDDGKDAYPEMRYIKYPKPGYDNPIVEMMFLDLKSSEVFAVPVEDNPPIDDLITEVAWTGKSQAIVRLSNRESDNLKVSVIDAKKRKGKIVRTTNFKDLDGGWAEVDRNMIYIHADPNNGRPEAGYIDTVVKSNNNHLAYFSPVDSAEPKAYLTNGPWEVDGGVSSFDSKTNTVYFIATKKSSTERHLYKVKLDGTGLTSVTDESKDGFYSAKFSHDSRFAVLSYQGPDVPWQKVIDLSEENPIFKGQLLEDNKPLRDRIVHYALPKANYGTLKVAKKGEDGAERDLFANTLEILPPDFSANKKYPVLVYVYGGPGSQQVRKIFNYDFQKIVTSHDMIVLICDGRGTGFMGRDFRSAVRDRLGYYETKDQITAAKAWAAKEYVDEDRIAIWGWSYGGYMTLKTLETDAGETFKYGMAVAPPTNWRFYDSIYTERYMHTPQHNEKGFLESSIRNVTAVAECERFLLMHGTGDDNVHFQNSLVFLDELDQGNVENYDMHIFPDSDHGIAYHNANNIVYDKLEHWIMDAFSGKFKNLQETINKGD